MKVSYSSAKLWLTFNYVGRKRRISHTFYGSHFIDFHQLQPSSAWLGVARFNPHISVNDGVVLLVENMKHEKKIDISLESQLNWISFSVAAIRKLFSLPDEMIEQIELISLFFVSYLRFPWNVLRFYTLCNRQVNLDSISPLDEGKRT